MPRKHARPAAQKRLEKLKERMAQGKKSRQLARPYHAEPLQVQTFFLGTFTAAIAAAQLHRRSFHHEN